MVNFTLKLEILERKEGRFNNILSAHSVTKPYFEQQKGKQEFMNKFIKRSLIGGVVSALFMGIAGFILGEISGFRAADLLSSSLSGINTLCNTVILGSSTILALMLTLLSLSRASHPKLNKEHYHRVLTLAQFLTILIVVAVVTFLLLNLPLVQSREVPKDWYSIIYYSSLVMASILGGGFIAIVTMLYEIISNIILIVGYRMENHPLVDSEDVEEAKKEEESENSGETSLKEEK